MTPKALLATAALPKRHQLFQIILWASISQYTYFQSLTLFFLLFQSLLSLCCPLLVPTSKHKSMSPRCFNKLINNLCNQLCLLFTHFNLSNCQISAAAFISPRISFHSNSSMKNIWFSKQSPMKTSVRFFMWKHHFKLLSVWFILFNKTVDLHTWNNFGSTCIWVRLLLAPCFFFVLFFFRSLKGNGYTR